MVHVGRTAWPLGNERPGEKVIALNGVQRPSGHCAVSTELFSAPVNISHRFVFTHATPLNCYFYGTALTELKIMM